jgi:hypothetical protein
MSLRLCEPHAIRRGVIGRRSGRGVIVYAQVLIQRLAADAEFAGKPGFFLTGAGTGTQFCDSLDRQRSFAPLVSAPLFCKGDPFALALLDQVAVSTSADEVVSTPLVPTVSPIRGWSNS